MVEQDMLVSGVWESFRGVKRRDAVELELARFNGNLSLADRKEKYFRMSDSVFAFYRGTAHLFYHDLAKRDWLHQSPFYQENAFTWIQGDLHLGNFGSFCDADEEVVFDLNDFDEAWISNYLYDVWRGAASLVLAAKELEFSDEEAGMAVDTFCKEYLEELDQYAFKDDEPYVQVRAEDAQGPLRKFLKKAAKKGSRLTMLEKWTIATEKSRKFNTELSKLESVSDDDFRILKAAIAAYKDNLDSPLKGDKKYFKVIDVARRLGAGVGSLGAPRYYVLIRGEGKDPDSYRILDVKQQSVPSFFRFLNEAEQRHLLDMYPETAAGCRVAYAQKAMLMDPDPHLGCVSILGRSFSVRERSPYKKSIKLEKLSNFEDFHGMAEHWGTILATAHARADNDELHFGPNHCMESVVTSKVRGKHQEFTDYIRNFAVGYAEQVFHDYGYFMRLREVGRVVS